MSSPVQISAITISGFRGIRLPLTIDMTNDSKAVSVQIYGRNGTGKSSITDAWEWLQSSNGVLHLAREGAQESSYPHIDAQRGQTYVEVTFMGNQLKPVRLTFEPTHVRTPTATGPLGNLRKMAPYPCQLRFEDLTRFVYSTKKDKYDELARLMSFEPQVKVQTTLRTAEHEFGGLVKEKQKTLDDIQIKLKELLGQGVINESTFLEKMNEILTQHGCESCCSLQGLRGHLDGLRARVEKDPTMAELASLKQLRGKLRNPGCVDDDYGETLLHYLECCDRLAADEESLFNIIRLDLYEQGESVLKEMARAKKDCNICPLCGQRFEGSLGLAAHVSQELRALSALKAQRDEANRMRDKLLTLTTSLTKEVDSLFQSVVEQTALLESQHVGKLEELGSLREALDRAEASLKLKPEDLTAPKRIELKAIKQVIHDQRIEVSSWVRNAASLVDGRIGQLESDGLRAKLVKDERLLDQAYNCWNEHLAARRDLDVWVGVRDRFGAAVNGYIQESLSNVRARFNSISDNVEKYFGILEQGAKYLGKPALRLDEDKDRAVVLEVGFYDDRISPAYKYLSESQLNSFGLAIFLACARECNSALRFLLLDDIVNSLDSYKRPLVIHLLRDEFSDFQILLLTHDDRWCGELCDKLPQWKRRRFSSLDRYRGPVDAQFSEPPTSLQWIEKLISEDRADDAGRAMGWYLERHLQSLCEGLRARLRYSQRNEHTLDELLCGLQAIINKDLGKKHPLAVAVQDLLVNSGFRNACVHYKDAFVAPSSSEMLTTVSVWNKLYAMVWCDDCGQYVSSDGSGVYMCKCKCGGIRLTKQS